VAKVTAETENKMRTLALGTKVRLVSVDKFGFVGREKHPTQADIGFEGYIMDIAHDSDQDCNDIPDYTYYLVQAGDKELECMDHEVEECCDEDASVSELSAVECQALYVLLTKDHPERSRRDGGLLPLTSALNAYAPA
jgi:hypothetical protein